MKGEEAYIKETQTFLNQIESIIISRNENLEICLWRTLDSTLNILFIFTPKLNQHTNTSFYDHLVTVVNASTLLASVIKVILSKFKHNDPSVLDTTVATNQLVDMIKRMKFLVDHEPNYTERNYKLLILMQVHQTIKSLLSVFLIKKSRYAKPITPPLTPASSTFSQDEEFDPTFYYQGGMQSTRVSQSESDTVGKRFIRSFSLRKSMDDLGSTRSKIDSDRDTFFSQNDFHINDKNSSRAGTKQQHKSNRFKQLIHNHIKDIFEPSSEPSKPVLKQSTSLTTSDSGCFTSFPVNNKPLQRSLTTSIQKEFAEPVFVKQESKHLKYNKSESDLKQIMTILQNKEEDWSTIKQQYLQKKKLYNCHDQDNDDEILLFHAKEKGKEGSIFHFSENGRDVLILEMVSSHKLQVVAGTLERLFIKLADETSQDLDYVDTYILAHPFFTDSSDLLENLMARFHLESLPGEISHFKKWQRCIQVKVLNVISRWIKLQYQDFQHNKRLITRLEAFLNGDVTRAGFTIEADMIKEALDRQRVQTLKPKHVQIMQSTASLFHCSEGLNRRPSITPSFLSFVSLSTPPESPTHQDVLLSLHSKDIAKYLTLADFYVMKCITAQDYLAMYYPTSTTSKHDYIHMMTKRANKLTQWVLYEITAHKINSKQRKTVIRKMIEIAKLCQSWNNFHTCMVITMGLMQLTEFRSGDWQLANRDMKNLAKFLSVGNNMSYYRTAFKKSAKAPCIPFFPIIMKDLTFLMDGNSTKRSDGLINFNKFRALMNSIHTLLYYTMENYYFASDLTSFPFFPNHDPTVLDTNSLDHVASVIEAHINAACQEEK